MTTIKQCKDGFVWLVLTQFQAQAIYENDIFDLYALYDDDSEALIEEYSQIENLMSKGCQIGIEVGFTTKRQFNERRRKADKATR